MRRHWRDNQWSDPAALFRQEVNEMRLGHGEGAARVGVVNGQALAPGFVQLVEDVPAVSKVR